MVIHQDFFFLWNKDETIHAARLKRFGKPNEAEKQSIVNLVANWFAFHILNNEPAGLVQGIRVCYQVQLKNIMLIKLWFKNAKGLLATVSTAVPI